VEITGRKSPLLTKKVAKKKLDQPTGEQLASADAILQALDYGLVEEVGWPRTERSAEVLDF
jgi:hypothetical protein